MFSLVFIVYSKEDMLGVFILEVRTLIAVGYTFLKSLFTLLLLPVGALRFPLVSEGQSCRGIGPVHQREKENLKGESKKNKNKTRGDEL